MPKTNCFESIKPALLILKYQIAHTHTHLKAFIKEGKDSPTELFFLFITESLSRAMSPATTTEIHVSEKPYKQGTIVSVQKPEVELSPCAPLQWYCHFLF